MKAIANTTISLGLINLPVGICKATGELEDVKFNLGDAQGRRLTQQYVDPDGKVVAREDQTKTIDGYVMDTDALDAIAERTKLGGLHMDEIISRDELLKDFNRVTGYYLLQSTPKTGNLNAYKLFVDALEEIDGVAVTKFTFRSRQQQIAVWSDAGVLKAVTMTFASDVREGDEVTRAHYAATYTDAEFDMAVQLLTALKVDEPKVFRNDTDEAVALRHELVEMATQGESIDKPAEAAQPVKNAALADALAESLAAIKAQQKVAA